ncbi:MAG: MarR family transcriptional regulator [Microbacteriaceae bacterium]|nr:MarR family transcriptional regulator [Microbacteriaceae bacterium]
MDNTSEDALELDRQVCFALAVASRSVIGIYRPILEPLGLTHPQYLVMLALWGDKKLRFKKLAHMLRLDSATLSPIVKRLEHSGLVERISAADDERTFDIVPTQAGIALREKALGVPPAVIKRLGLPVDYLVSLRDTLTAVISAADQNS